MFATIQNELKKLEAASQIRILYAVESGSRAWGFASRNSDWDVRFIYVHPPEWYLQLSPQKDCIEQMLPGDLDLSGWELQKTLRLFRKSNPPLLEWLHSPIIYRQEDAFRSAMQQASAHYFSPQNCLYHYFHMARRNWEAYFKTTEVRLKKYLYVLRPILACMWIEQTGTMVPMEFDTLKTATIKAEQQLLATINGLLERKKSGEEWHTGPRLGVLDAFLEKQFHYYEALLKTWPVNDVPGWKELNLLFRHTLQQSWPAENTRLFAATTYQHQK